MIALVWVFASVAVLMHIVVFFWEAVLFRRPEAHQRCSRLRRPMCLPFCCGVSGSVFYNLFLGVGTIVGVIAWIAGKAVVGQTLVIYPCLFMFLSGIVLLIADRMARGRRRGKGLGGADPGRSASHRPARCRGLNRERRHCGARTGSTVGSPMRSEGAR
jgi:putative membrane protein